MNPLLIYHDNIPQLNLSTGLSPIKPLKKYESGTTLDQELKNITFENLHSDKENSHKLPSLDTISKLNSLTMPKMSNKVHDIEARLHKIIDNLHNIDENCIKLVEINLDLINELHKLVLCQKIYTMKKTMLMRQLQIGPTCSTPRNESEFSMSDYEV